ncbi:hypothetical protein CUC53_08045 [Aeromonas cavernicola]|uniref:Uncharacterized protein n=1 Tax=Aeromonas cavernicola TaxID=1006623 RepID=A0A2H9U5B3_9GAMM|nr:hypothetical protein CUC53_08045 [Aeromonas cavernicola]
MSLLVVVFDLFVFTPWVKKWRDNAARIQEVFDTNLFELEWNEIVVGKKPEYELAYEKAKKYGLDAERIVNLKEWYPTVIDKVTSIFGVFFCQRVNIYWDTRMRLRYSLAVRMILVLIELGVMGYGIYTKKDMF